MNQNALTPIYEGGVEWTWGGGTELSSVELEDGSYSGDQEQEPVSDEFYYIVPDKCTEYWFPRRATMCCCLSVDCCVDDPDYETEEELLAKEWLHDQ